MPFLYSAEMLSPFVIYCLEFQIFFAFKHELLVKKKQHNENKKPTLDLIRL